MDQREVPMPAFLAQLNLQSPVIPPLPAPPLVERLTLEDPIAGVVLLLALAVALFFVLNARGRIRQACAAAGALALLAAGLLALASFVDTDREIIAARTRELVAAVSAADRAQMDQLLADDLTVRVTRVPPGASKEVVMATVESEVRTLYHASEHEVLDLQAAMYGPRVGRTQTRVRVGSEYGAIPSWWRLDWQRGNDGRWRATRIEALWIPGVPNPAG
jgi:hypothetical protein